MYNRFFYRGVYCFSDPQKNRKQRLKTYGFTSNDLEVGSLISYKGHLFKILVKETWDGDDCLVKEPLSVEMDEFVEKTKNGYKILWDKKI